MAQFVQAFLRSMRAANSQLWETKTSMKHPINVSRVNLDDVSLSLSVVYMFDNILNLNSVVVNQDLALRNADLKTRLAQSEKLFVISN